MNKKILIAGLLTLASVAGVVGTVGNATKVEAALPTKVYLDPNMWDGSSARFAAYFWDSASATWHNMTDTDGDGIFEVNVPANCKKVIFGRMNKTSTANNWNNVWNQTEDLTLPTDGKNLYTISGWDNGSNGKSGGSWGTYSTYTARTLTLVGTLPNANWDTTCEEYLFADSNQDNVYEIELDLPAGEYSFKIAQDKKWDVSYGASNAVKVFEDTLSNEVLTASNGKDLTLKATGKGGKYTFSFNYQTKILNVTCVPTPDYDAQVKELFTRYYNNGTYTKDSVLYVNKLAEEEVGKYFHASADVKYRKTVYTSTGLSMTTSVDGSNYSLEASVYTNIGNNEGVAHTGAGGNYTYTAKKSVEDWFVTLFDFKELTTSGWTYSNGIYSHTLTPAAATEEADLTRMAREFVAPMWLAPTAANYNYARFNKLTVEESNGSLIMKLYVENGDILVDGSNNVFSQVTIY